MKKLLIILFLAMACNEQPKVAGSHAVVFNEEADQEALMKTIKNETEAFYKGDYEGWRQQFVQVPYAFQGWNNSDGSFDASTGWEAIDGRTKEYINSHPLKQGESYYPKVERRNMTVKFFSDSLAYLSWDQYNGDKGNKWFIHSKDQRIMQKEGGAWKIANVTSFWNYKNKLPADSLPPGQLAMGNEQ